MRHAGGRHTKTPNQAQPDGYPFNHPTDALSAEAPEKNGLPPGKPPMRYIMLRQN